MAVLTTCVRARARAAVLAVAIACLFGAPGTASANAPSALPAELAAAASANPGATFRVIVQVRGAQKANVTAAVDAARKDRPGKANGITRALGIIDGAAAELTGAQILDLAKQGNVVAITRDLPVAASGNGNGGGKGGGNGNGNTRPPAATTTDTSTTSTIWPFEGSYWPYISGVTGFWQKSGKNAVPAPQAPTIAVVDSGIDASNPIFGGRVIKQVTLTNLTPNSPGDGYGHGTYVAGLAAGWIGNWGGASPTSKLLSLDVMDDDGMAMTSDVIAAADWIYQNKDQYGIRVANFSLHATKKSSFLTDPLDAAVEKLWLSGVVVVAAAGNYGTADGPSGVLYAPANDPFVLTVGALDANNTMETSDDFPAPWSAYGYTHDGFAKPEISAPGRFMIGAVPTSAVMAQEHPERILAPGFMKLSGTSFATPIVAGAAADLLALHPHWTADQVKGALMMSARPISPSAPARSGGVGELKLDAAASVLQPANPNAALEKYLVADPLGGPTPVFDPAAWVADASTNPTWDAASWGDASWGDASWGEASWSDASWGESDASWGDPDASWGDISAGAKSLAALVWVD